MRSWLVAVTLVGGWVALDEADPTPLGASAEPLSVCGTSLQAAINAAAPDAIIEVCAGTYAERLVVDGKRIELRGAGAGATIIDAGTLGRALTISSVGGTGVTVRGLTLRNGKTAGTGAGISCTGSRLVVRDSILGGNRATSGGGLAADGCVLDVAGTRFENNDASGARGGGVLTTASSGLLAGNTSSREGAAPPQLIIQ